MDSEPKSKVLFFLIALAIPTIVFIIMAYMMSALLKENVTLSPNIFLVMIVTFFLIASAELINEKTSSALGKSIGILIGTAILFGYFNAFIEVFCESYFGSTVPFKKEDIIAILIICGWILSVFMWTYNLFKKQKDVTNIDNANKETDDNDDLIGGWYGCDSNLSCWLPVLAFEKNYNATFSDGKVVKEYSYHICCSTCIILTAKDGEKVFVKRVWIQEKPHLFYDGQTYTRDGKHCE